MSSSMTDYARGLSRNIENLYGKLQGIVGSQDVSDLQGASARLKEEVESLIGQLQTLRRSRTLPGDCHS